MTYGGDEEIVLKGGAKKSVKAGNGKVVEQKKNVCTAFIRVLQNIDSYRRMGISSRS
jgi:hypothetical protein